MRGHRQRTHATTGWECPLCALRCRSLTGLQHHLQATHIHFNFGFSAPVRRAAGLPETALSHLQWDLTSLPSPVRSRQWRRHALMQPISACSRSAVPSVRVTPLEDAELERGRLLAQVEKEVRSVRRNRVPSRTCLNAAHLLSFSLSAPTALAVQAHRCPLPAPGDRPRGAAARAAGEAAGV